MSSPYTTTSSLLSRPVDDDVTNIPRPNVTPLNDPWAGHERLETVVHAQPAPAPVHYHPAPMPVQYVQQGGGGAVTATATGIATIVAGVIIAILVGIVALIGGYFAAQAASPSAEEFAVSQQIARETSALSAHQQGVATGRSIGFTRTSETARASTALAAERSWNSGFESGKKLGNRTYRNAYRGGSYTPYRAPRYSYGGYDAGLAGALMSAQSLANVTGAPVDVEVY